MAKMIKFNLTLSGATVSTFDELQDNFSAEILPIYRTGRLLKWLQARELTEQVQAVQAITPSDDDRGLLGALCRALDLDDDAEVINFLLEDWQASQERQTDVQTAPTTSADSDTQSAEIEGEVDGAADSAPAAEPVDWSGQNMSGRDFDGGDFRNGIFKGTNFSNCTFKDCNFSGADLTDAKLDRATLKQVIFEKSRLQGISFASTKFSNCSFDHVCLEEGFSNNGGEFISTTFKAASLLINTTAKFTSCDFTDGQMSGSEFGGDIHDCNFSGAKIDSAHFKARLTSCNFTNSELTGGIFLTSVKSSWSSDRLFDEVRLCCFERSNLANSKFPSGAIQCNFSNANLAQSEFSRTTSWSDFSAANMQFAIFKKDARTKPNNNTELNAPICFSGTNLMGVKGLTKEQAEEHTRIYIEWLQKQEEDAKESEKRCA